MDKKSTIAQVVCTYPPYRGGMGQVAFEYTERLRQRGYNVHVFTSKHHDSRPDPKIVDPSYVHRLPSLLHLGNASVMPSLFRRLSGFDLVHLHYPFFGGAEPTIVRKALRHDQGLVMTYHMDAVAGGVRGALFQAHRRMLLPWLVNRTDRILVSSQDYFETSALAQLADIQDRVEIHPFGIDLKRFQPDQTAQGPIPTILFVGGLDDAHHFKGVPVLLEALSKLLSEEWRAVLVGEGHLRSAFEKMARTWGMSERVVFAGNVSDEELPLYYRKADIHVFPSTRRAEAFGLVALEAAASGVPTIASSLPGVRTVVQDGSTGLLVEPENVSALANALKLLLTQNELRLRFGAAARMHAQTNFAWDPLINRLEETYHSVLQQQSAREYTSTSL